MKIQINFYHILLTFAICYGLTNNADHKKADMVIFSFNRPLQLYALLESIEEYVQDIDHMFVIYRTTEQPFDAAYDQVQQRFSNITYIKQGAEPYKDFKPLVLKTVFESPSEYILFAVDDNIFIDYVSLDRCINALDQWHAYAFYLKMGLHLTECYSMRSPQRLPPFKEVEEGVFAWQFKQGIHDWNYPNTVDATLYRKKDIYNDLHSETYKAPNSFEAAWAGRAQFINNPIGLCFACTKAVNIPLNSVQSEWTNRNMNFLTPEQMLEIFNAGKKIDRKPLHHIKNKAVHMPYEPTFIDRINA